MTLNIDDSQIRLLQGLFDLFDEPTELALVPILFPGIELQQQTIKHPTEAPGSTAILITASRMASGVAVV